MDCAFFFVPFFYFLKKLSFRVDKSSILLSLSSSSYYHENFHCFFFSLSMKKATHQYFY